MKKRLRPESLDKQVRQQDTFSHVFPQKKEVQQTLVIGKETSKKIMGNFSMYDKSKEKNLPRQFFRQEVVVLAQALLGKIFVRETEQGVIRAIIVQTQAYKAPLDKACHAHKGKKTERTKYFWLDGGHLYVYTIYMPTNFCLNIVAGLKDQPEAVLIRAVQPLQGIEHMKALRNIKSNKLEDLCNGPGKVGMSLAVNKQMNGIDLLEGAFKIVDAGFKDFKISTSKRINIEYAQQWREKPWRFYVEGNSFVSKVDPNKPAVKKK